MKMAKTSKTKTILNGISPDVTVSELLIGNRKIVTGYHSQEYRPVELTKPIKCFAKDAWLGPGFYFWVEVIYAHFWGQDFKVFGKSKSYDIYKADLKVENCLNTVFNEEHYLFFKEMVEIAIKNCKSINRTVTLDEVHVFLAKVWLKFGIEGIIYDDKPTNSKNKSRVYSEIPDLYYKKRIQVVIFDMKNIRNFELYLEEQQ